MIIPLFVGDKEIPEEKPLNATYDGYGGFEVDEEDLPEEWAGMSFEDDEYHDGGEGIILCKVACRRCYQESLAKPAVSAVSST